MKFEAYKSNLMWFKLFMSENCYNFVFAIKPSIKWHDQ